MKSHLLALLLVALPCLAWADPLPVEQKVIRVIFQSSPSGAQVSIGHDREKSTPLTPDREGVTLINLSKQVPSPGTTNLYFHLEGCEDVQQSVTLDNLSEEGVLNHTSQSKLQATAQPGVYLYKEKIALSPLNLLQWLRYHPFIVLFLATLLGGGTVALWNARQKLAREKAFNARRDNLVAEGDPRFPLIDKVLGGYLLVDKLGAGGFASVYRGVPHETLDEKEAVAVKVIQPDLDDPEFRDRFVREIDVTRRLQHPNIVRVVDWGEHEQHKILYLVMELVEGRPLRIPDKGMSIEEAQFLLGPLINALSYAHNQGIIHRDIKPDNIMVSRNGRVKLMDFGIARGRDYKTVTATGAALGTPAYMPPEQLMGQAVDPRADQYSLGIMLYEMLCGQVPFNDAEAVVTLMRHLNDTPRPLRSLNPNISPEVEAVVMKMLNKEPRKRFATLLEMQTALNRAIGT